MSRAPAQRDGRIRAIFAAVLLAAPFLWLYGLGSLVGEVHSQPRRAPARVSRPNYREFNHATQAHQKDCATCHKFPSENWQTVRKTGAFPDITEYPSHESCLNCHRQQFFRGAAPAICSICHINPSPRDSRTHPFANPREVFDTTAKGKRAVSDFDIRFPHATHVEIVSETRSSDRPWFRLAAYVERSAAAESCAVCHKTLSPQGEGKDEYETKSPANLGDGFWLKKGTFMSSPTGHSTCFTCHSADSGIAPLPASCGSCHSIKQKSPPADFDVRLAATMGVTDKVVLDAWRGRHSSGKYRHEWFSHAEMSCSTCHTVEKMNTPDPTTKRVPIASCSTCHATATVDDGGALTFEADARRKNAKFTCTKCHVAFGSQPIPASHLEALKEAGFKQ
jgi:hypothetical protein